MAKRDQIEFIEAESPITKLVTKFGGQPIWLHEPQWPLSRATGKPMRFIGQLAIEKEIFGQVPAQMAYLFMTDEDEHIDGTWEPDGGENAVVVQPGVVDFPTKKLSDGPCIYRMVKKFLHKNLVPQGCEFSVRLTRGDDPDFATNSERLQWDESKDGAYAAALQGNKIGGTPIFLQDDEFPKPGGWRLLLQLDSASVPFHINFGDTGVGYAFLSEDGQRGKFLWQCA